MWSAAKQVIANNHTMVTASVQPPSDNYQHVGVLGCDAALLDYRAWKLRIT